LIIFEPRPRQVSKVHRAFSERRQYHKGTWPLPTICDNFPEGCRRQFAS
jgi:hypothetical protein